MMRRLARAAANAQCSGSTENLADEPLDLSTPFTVHIRESCAVALSLLQTIPA